MKFQGSTGQNDESLPRRYLKASSRVGGELVSLMMSRQNDKTNALSAQSGCRINERRKKYRYAFRHTVVLKLYQENTWIEFWGITDNVSEIGALILFDSIEYPAINGDVAVEIVDSAYPIRLCSSGKVMRVEQRIETGAVAIAVRCNKFKISKADLTK